jgi:hypothetical protein
MKNNLLSILLLSIFMFPATVFGQFGPEISSTMRMEMPSPTAASIAKFDAFPVDHYTGLPSLSVPPL